jgi:hypothetical protein
MSKLCRVCSSIKLKFLFEGPLLDKKVKYYECSVCGYVQTQEPDWLDKAYSAPINLTDVGIMSRNLGNVKVVLASLIVLGSLHGRVIDKAGGYGILVRLLRDHGVKAFWDDLYCENLIAKGYEYVDGVRGDLVTCFEAYEHFVHPMDEMERLIEAGPNILLSTELISTPAPLPGNWYYYGANHGQHIGFYRLQTLEYMAHKFEKYLISDGHSYHLFSERSISKVAWKSLINIGKLNPKILSLLIQQKIDDSVAVFFS